MRPPLLSALAAAALMALASPAFALSIAGAAPDATEEPVASTTPSLSAMGTTPGTPAPLSVEIVGPWTPVAPPGVESLAGFFVLRNTGKSPLRLVGVTSQLFEEVQMHTMVKEDGRVVMRPLSEVLIPAGQDFAFRPGADHLMLVGPKQPVKLGDRLPVVLNFGPDGKRPVVLEVRGEAPVAPR